MKKINCVFRYILPAMLAAGLVLSGCSAPFKNSLTQNGVADTLEVKLQANNQEVLKNTLGGQDNVAMLAPVSEFDSVESTMRIMEQSLFRPSLEEKEQISELVLDYLTQLAEADYQNITGEEGIELIYPSNRLEIRGKAEELIKYYQDHQLVYEVADLEADFVIVTPFGARARVTGILKQKGVDVTNLEYKKFYAFFYLKKLQDKWYIEKAPTMKFLAEMNILSENDEQQIKELMHNYIYATMHFNYHNLTGKEGFDFMAPPLPNDQVIAKLAADKVKQCQENEWVQTVNNMIAYFIYGTAEEANVVVAGTYDRSGKTDVHSNRPFEGQYALKKVDGQWRISTIKKYVE